MSDVNVETIAETENYVAWLSTEPDGEKVVHLELGAVTLHFFREEWDEVVELVEAAKQETRPARGGGQGSKRRKNE